MKTETDVYIDIEKMFKTDFQDSDVSGLIIGPGLGTFYPITNVYSFFQGHAIWYSQKAARFVADELLETYTKLSPSVTYIVGQLDPGPRAADLWSMQVLIPKWKEGLITMKSATGYANGPYTFHLQGNDDVKARASEWIRNMHYQVKRELR